MTARVSSADDEPHDCGWRCAERQPHADSRVRCAPRMRTPRDISDRRQGERDAAHVAVVAAAPCAVSQPFVESVRPRCRSQSNAWIDSRDEAGHLRRESWSMHSHQQRREQSDVLQGHVEQRRDVVRHRLRARVVHGTSDSRDLDPADNECLAQRRVRASISAPSLVDDRRVPASSGVGGFEIPAGNDRNAQRLEISGRSLEIHNRSSLVARRLLRKTNERWKAATVKVGSRGFQIPMRQQCPAAAPAART